MMTSFASDSDRGWRRTPERTRPVAYTPAGDIITTTAVAVEAHFRGTLPPVALRALVVAVREAGGHLDVGTLALRCEVPRRTLSRRLLRAGMPTPEGVIAWGKILVASELLTRRRKVESAAVQLNLGGSSELVHLFERYTGRTPGEIRAAGGLRIALDNLLARVLARRAAL